MNAGRGVKRKRGPTKPHQGTQTKVSISFESSPRRHLSKTPIIRLTPPPNKSFPANSYADFHLRPVYDERANSTSPRKHHSLQEFKRLAKQAKVNETQIIVKKLKSLRSSDGKANDNPARAVQDLEAQLTALKVCYARYRGMFVFSPRPGFQPSALRGRCPHPKTQAQPHPLRRSNCVEIPLL